jgi:hypothetical protein
MSGNKKFFAFSASCVGASHLKINKPCQDYCAHFACDDFAIAVVADGHGSDIHFRSERGSRFACEVTMDILKKYAARINEKEYDTVLAPDDPKYAKMQRFGQQAFTSDLTGDIVSGWRERAFNDWFSDTPKIDYAPNSEAIDFALIYGTTLIAVLITKTVTVALQIGDGKCVMFDKDGVASQPVPPDDDCYMNVTTSLCEADAKDHFRIFVLDEMPAAIFLGTDGVDNSYPMFENEKHLAALYGEIHKNFLSVGLDEGVKQLQDFLPVLTQKGSGDDVSIAGILVSAPASVPMEE